MASTALPKTRTAWPIIRVAVLDPRCAAPPVVRRLFGGAEWCRPTYLEVATIDQKRAAFQVIVLVDSENPAAPGPNPVQLALDGGADPVPLVILTGRPAAFAIVDAPHVCLAPDSPIELVHGAMLGLVAARAQLSRIERERIQMRRLSESLHKHFTAIDTELRLASRLQKDFLPRDMQQIGPARFATLYRPCSFVSGDIFDVFRLDEHHVGFYLADAVGHGVAAGLLTMYIKHAICPKRVFEGGYEILPPATVLSNLNDQLAAHELHDAQFITGWYGLLDLRTGRLEYSVAGHPPPFAIRANGEISELHGEGTLLGLSAGQEFSSESTTLNPGDRVMVYSDGLDHVLIAHRPPLPEMPQLHAGIPQLFRRPTDELFAGLEHQLDNSPGSLSKGDDVSVLVLEFGADRGPTPSTP